jgi:hypothetical protein
MPRWIIRRFLHRLIQEDLHPELLGTRKDHPDAHKREGFTPEALATLAESAGLIMERSLTYRFPAPDKVLQLLPRRFSGWLANIGARPFPGALEVFAAFRRPGSAE